MIRLVTGPLGTGKSYYGVRKAVEGLERGKIVITNFAMEDDWVARSFGAASSARTRPSWRSGSRASKLATTASKRCLS